MSEITVMSGYFLKTEVTDMTEKYEYSDKKQNSMGALFWIFTVATALVVLIVFAVPILLDEAGVDQNGGLTVSEVVDNPQRYAGQVIALEGEVDETVGSRGFTLDGPGVVEDQMLVLSRQPLEAVGGGLQDGNLFVRDDEVIISGIVRQMNRSELEQELGVSLSEEEYENYEGRYIFVADTVTKTDQ